MSISALLLTDDAKNWYRSKNDALGVVVELGEAFVHDWKAWGRAGVLGRIVGRGLDQEDALGHSRGEISHIESLFQNPKEDQAI